VKTVFAFCFLGLMAILGGAGVFACLERYRSLHERRIAPNAPIVTSFRTRYPFKDEVEVETIARPSCLRTLTSGVDCYLSRLNLLLGSFQQAVDAYDRLSGNDLLMNGSEPILRLENGYYTCLFPYSDSAKTWSGLRDFAVWLKERNIRCLHLLPPYKFDDRVTVFPEDIPHGYARMVAEYQQFLSSNGIPCLDASPLLLAEDPDFYSWFYKVLNYHTARAGLTIARATAQKLNDELEIPADIEAVRPENFTRTVYPKLFRAPPWAQGRDAAGEDFEVLYPMTGGRFRVEVPSAGMDRSGEFRDTLIAQNSLRSMFCPHAFLYGYPPLVQVENLTCPNRTRVLIIRRCDTGNVFPYLACAVRHLDAIFPSSFDGSIRTFIEQTRPDVVIFCTYPQRAAGEVFWRLK